MEKYIESLIFSELHVQRAKHIRNSAFHKPRRVLITYTHERQDNPVSLTQFPTMGLQTQKPKTGTSSSRIMRGAASDNVKHMTANASPATRGRGAFALQKRPFKTKQVPLRFN